LTPEGRVKAAVKRLLADPRWKDEIMAIWPVPSGYGPSLLDCYVCHRGRFIAIETKAPGKKPTSRQQLDIEAVLRAGGAAFVIDGTNLRELEDYLECNQR
jgi:hypothetical protein